MPTADAVVLSLFAVIIGALLVRVRRERRNPELAPSAATWIGVGLVLGYITVACANIVVFAVIHG